MNIETRRFIWGILVFLVNITIFIIIGLAIKFSFSFQFFISFLALLLTAYGSNRGIRITESTIK